MKAMQFRRYGSVDVLEMAERERPVPGEHQCLVRVLASSVNPVDWKIRQGRLRFILPLRLPYVPGLDICGEVVAVGQEVTRFKEGDSVYGMVAALTGGGLGEYALLPEANGAVRPERLSVEEAAALPLAVLTAYQALKAKAHLGADQHVLVNGASGGVGHLAVQIAKALGAQVTAVCGTDNVGWVSQLGADRVIDYTKEDYKRENTSYHVIFDAVAADSYPATADLLTSQGVYVSTLPSPSLLLSVALLPLVSRKRARLVMVKPSGTDLEELGAYIKEGRLGPVIDRVYPLAEARAAHRRSQEGHAKGKIVIRVQE